MPAPASRAACSCRATARPPTQSITVNHNDPGGIRNSGVEAILIYNFTARRRHHLYGIGRCRRRRLSVKSSGGPVSVTQTAGTVNVRLRSRPQTSGSVNINTVGSRIGMPCSPAISAQRGSIGLHDRDRRSHGGQSERVRASTFSWATVAGSPDAISASRPTATLSAHLHVNDGDRHRRSHDQRRRHRRHHCRGDQSGQHQRRQGQSQSGRCRRRQAV